MNFSPATSYRRALPSGELMHFSISGFDRLGVAQQVATFWDGSSRLRGGTGYGASDEAALVGALGQMTEKYSASRAFTLLKHEADTLEEMCARYGDLALPDPRELGLEAARAYDASAPRVWTSLLAWPEAHERWVPAEWIATSAGDVHALAREHGLGAYEPLITPITHGLGAGTSPQMAVVHGLLDLLQRDTSGLRTRALSGASDGTALGGSALDPSTLPEPARIFLARAERADIEVRVRLVARERGVFSFYVWGLDRFDHPGQSSALKALAGGEACDTDPERALIKALRGWGAARARLAFMHGDLDLVRELTPPTYVERALACIDPHAQEPRAMNAMRAWRRLEFDTVRERLKPLLGVTNWMSWQEALALEELGEASVPEPSEEAALERLTAELSSRDHEVLIADFGSSLELDGVSAVKVVVPGLEAETLSSGRIGATNSRRLLDHPLGLVRRSPATGAHRVHLTERAEAGLGGPLWFDAAAADRLMEPFYAFYREPGRHCAPLLDEQESHDSSATPM